MNALRVIGYVVGGLFLALVVVLGVAAYLDHIDPQGPPQLSQSMSAGGKTVHFVTKGAVSYTASNEGDTILVNGKPLDLSGGDVFTAEIAADGTTSLRPGKP
jgi:hypothetical protein